MVSSIGCYGISNSCQIYLKGIIITCYTTLLGPWTSLWKIKKSKKVTKKSMLGPRKSSIMNWFKLASACHHSHRMMMYWPLDSLINILLFELMIENEKKYYWLTRIVFSWFINTILVTTMGENLFFTFLARINLNL